MDALGREQRKSCVQIETQLRAEEAKGAGTGAIALARSVFQHLLHQIEVLAHEFRIEEGED
jgi:hypothetical protein